MIAAAAAIARQRLLNEEEEHLSQYSPEDLAQGWEFKIVRSNTAAFGKSAVMEKVCSDEAQCGWVLVEKFDDCRLRFKRPASARNLPAPIGIDPYRTNYGFSQGRMVALVFLLGAVFALLFLLMILFKTHR
jgi:hypothetical protein